MQLSVIVFGTVLGILLGYVYNSPEVLASIKWFLRRYLGDVPISVIKNKRNDDAPIKRLLVLIAMEG